MVNNIMARPKNCGKCKKPKTECNCGRPTVMTEVVLHKLETAFMNAFTDEMACLYADISETALYNYCLANPEFAKRKEVLKMNPNLTAQKTLVDDLKNTGGARWWAEKKMPDFMPKTKIELNQPLNVDTSQITESVRAVTEEFEEKMRKLLTSKPK